MDSNDFSDRSHKDFVVERGRCEKLVLMSRWRWRLFKILARFELSEEAYWRLPTSATFTESVATLVGAPLPDADGTATPES